MSTYLRPQQIKDLESERGQLTKMSQDPGAQIQDPAALHNRVRSIEQQIEQQSPPPIAPGDLDAVVKKEAELRKYLLDGMPSQEEMRKSPTGAIGKHQRWDKRAKKVINENGERAMDAWKNARLRLQLGNSDPDVANFEMFRPRLSTLGMDGAYIQGKDYDIPTEAFKRGWDRMQEEGGSDEMNSLRTELLALRKMISDKQVVIPVEDAPSVSEPAEELISQTCICGKKFKPMSAKRLAFSIRSHQRYCAVSQDVKE